jgi:transcriptional regulator with XRE-family HTH domain
MQNEEIFGKILQEKRKSKNFSQEKLAKRTGLNRTFISLIENGKRSPSLSTILKISSALHIKPSDLFISFESRRSDLQVTTGEKNGE